MVKKESLDKNGQLRIEVKTNLDPKRNCGVQFDNYGKCPKCGSTKSGMKSTPEEEDITGMFEYECLICGAQWTEFIIDHEAVQKKE